MEKPELKPCPFCGGTVEMSGEPEFKTMIYCRDRRAGGFFIECECGCQLGYQGSQDDLDLEFGKFSSAEEAATAWNKRP